MPPEPVHHPDPAVCPLCGQPNDCAVAADPEAEQCWCQDLLFPDGLLDQVPERARRKACICRNCLESYHLETEEGGS